MKPHPFDLSDEVAVVIGGTGALGGAIAEGLAGAGARVAVVGRAHAATNPKAWFHGRPITLEEHQASRWIAEPSPSPSVRPASTCSPNTRTGSSTSTPTSTRVSLRPSPRF